MIHRNGSEWRQCQWNFLPAKIFHSFFNLTLGIIMAGYNSTSEVGCFYDFEDLKNVSGEKPSSKRRKGKNNVETRPITEEEDSHNLSHPKAPHYTEYYHNDEPFSVVLAKNYPQASQCIACDIAFPRRMPLAPYDLAFLLTQGTLGVPGKRRQGENYGKEDHKDEIDQSIR